MDGSPARLVETSRVYVRLGDDVDTALLCGLLGGGDPAEVVCPVEAVGGREVDVGWPDYVGVAYVPVVPEGVDEGEVLPPLLHHHQVIEVAPVVQDRRVRRRVLGDVLEYPAPPVVAAHVVGRVALPEDRKSTRLNSSHANISYAVFCLKKKQVKRALVPAAVRHPL